MFVMMVREFLRCFGPVVVCNIEPQAREAETVETDALTQVCPV